MTRPAVFRLLMAHGLGAGVLVVGCLVGSACGGSSGDTGPSQPECPDESAVTCPATPPSYKTDVQPIFQERCYGCHGPGGVEVSSINLSSYKGIVKNYGDIVSQIAHCQMPEADAGQLTLEERVTLTEWLQCMAPNN